MESLICSDQSFQSFESRTIGSFEFVYYTLRSPLKTTPNEDALGFVILDDQRLVLMVADGAGGHPKGEEASKKALESIRDEIVNAEKSKNKDKLRNVILDGIESANNTLLNDGSGSKTTVTACEITGAKIRIYQVGDSGALVCGQKGKLKYKSLFHSTVGYGVESGLLEEDEALQSEHLNEVANIVGDKEMSIEVGPTVDLDQRDTLFLATDGVFDNLSTEEITEMVRKGSLQEIAQQIIEYFQHKTEQDPEGHTIKYDDTTFFIFRSL